MGKTVERKRIRCTQVVEQIQQNTYDRNNKKNTTLEVLISNREKTSKKNLYRERHIPENTEQEQKRDQKTEFVEIVTKNFGI